MEHYRIVERTLNGTKVVDEQAFASLEVLDKRLERLKNANKEFSGVEFSPAVKELMSQRKAVAVC